MNIYLLNTESKWTKSNEPERIQLKQVFDRSKYPELLQPSPLSKEFEFFSWVKERANYKTSEKNTDACIMCTSKRFYVINLENGEVKEIVPTLKEGSGDWLVKGWTVFNNILLYVQGQNLIQASLYLDCNFGFSVQGPNVEEITSSPSAEIHFIRFEGFIAAVGTFGSQSSSFKMILFHFCRFQIESISGETQAEARVFSKMFDDEVDLVNRLPEEFSKSNVIDLREVTCGVLRLKYMISRNQSIFAFSRLRVEAKDSVVFLRGYKQVGFVDTLSKCQILSKRAPIPAKVSKESEVYVNEEPKKQKLINYQELTPNPNTTMMVEQIIEASEPTKTALKKELKGLDKSERQEKLKELTNGKREN